MLTPRAQGFFAVFRQKPRLTVSQWAEQNRYISSKGASEPGPWRNERTPYLVDIMDELSASSPTKEVVFCKGSQIGATEAGINWILYLMDCVPGPVMFLQPTIDEAETLSKQRLSPSIDMCQSLQGKVSDPKSRSSGNTILSKEFDGGYLFVRGADTSNALSSKPIGNLYLDEIDRYKDNVNGEGNPVALAKRRAATFQRAKVFYSSTPTLMKTSKIWKLYQDSDRRIYEVPCPECGHYQEIVLDRLSWDKGNYEDVCLACSGCGWLIPEDRKAQMLAAGKWRALNPGHKRAGFHLSALYSPYGWMSWGEIAETYDKAEGDEAEMIVVVNTILGLPYEDKSESLAEGYLARRVEKYDAPVPRDVLMLTMAVDVQKDRIEYEVLGWGDGEESWGIRYRTIHGDPSVLVSKNSEIPSVWQVLEQEFDRKFLHADGNEIGISQVFIDSGGTYTDTVYRYTVDRQAKGVFSIKGSSNMKDPLLSRPQRKGGVGAYLFILGVEKGKDQVFNNLRKEAPGPGYCHFPADENTGYDKHYYAGLQGERREYKRVNGVDMPKWTKIKGRHNEPWDLRVYGLAAQRWYMINHSWDELREQREAAVGKKVISNQTKKPARHHKGMRVGPRVGGSVKLIGD